MSEKYAPAILRWRQYAGHVDTWPSATVSTMLFGCQRWVELHSLSADEATREQVLSVKTELEVWVAQRSAALPSPGILGLGG